MGIVRLLIIGALVWLAFSLFKRFTNRPSISENRVKDNSSKKMVQCKQCGLHVPINEALPKGEDYFCCSNHRDQD